jgi:hypothetical protein
MKNDDSINISHETISIVRRVQIKKDGHAASTIGTSKMTTGNSFGVIPEVKIL